MFAVFMLRLVYNYSLSGIRECRSQFQHDIVFKQGFFKGVLGTRFGSLESEKIIIGPLK